MYSNIATYKCLLHCVNITMNELRCTYTTLYLYLTIIMWLLKAFLCLGRTIKVVLYCTL